MPSSLTATGGFVVVGIVVCSYPAFWFVYNRWFHPLKDVPGPFWASVTGWWYALAVRSGKGEKYQRAIHDRYGHMVRIAPNLVSLSDVHEIPMVYGSRPVFPKTSFYDSFVSGISTRRDTFSEREESKHHDRRRTVAPLYTQANVLSEAREAAIDSLIILFRERMTEVARRGEFVDMSAWLRKYAFDVIGVLFYGRRDGFGFIRDGRDHNGWCYLLDVMPPPVSAISYVPRGFRTLYLAVQILCSARARQGIRGMRTVVQQAHAAVAQRQRERMGAKDTPCGDLLDQLLALTTHHGGRFNVADVVTEVWAVIWAGSDTTATALTAIVYQLLLHPAVLARLRQEVQHAVAQGQLSNPIRYREARNLPYLHAVIREAMRTCPSVGTGFPRTVPAPGVVLGGRRFEPGCEVTMNPNVVHFDPSVFGEDCFVFRPERWLDDPARAQYMERHLLTFGYGSHVCLGKHVSVPFSPRLISPHMVNSIRLSRCPFPYSTPHPKT